MHFKKLTNMKTLFLKNSMLGKAFAALMFLFSAGCLHAQSTTDWTLRSEKNGVKLYSKKDTCAGKNMLFLKLENTNSAAKHVIYTIIIESPGRNMPLVPRSVELNATETKAGSCDSDKELTADIKNSTNPDLIVIMTVN